MRHNFTPEEVSEISLDDLLNLVGKYIVVEIEASEWYKENVPGGGDWEGGAGICYSAGFGSRLNSKGVKETVIDITFDYGMGFSWPKSKAAHIGVCDDHGEHRVRFNFEKNAYEDNGDPGAAECLSTLGFRGNNQDSQGVLDGEESK